MPDLRAQNRVHSAEYLGGGSALLAGSAYASHKLDRHLERTGQPKPLKAIAERKITRSHVGHVAGKGGVWAVRTTALPMAAYGAYGLLRPNRKTEKMRVGRDVVKPLMGNATLRSQSDKQARLSKRDSSFTRADQNRMLAHKKAGRLLSLASGTMGVTALGLRAPSLAGVAVRRSARARKVPGLTRLAGRRGSATQASNTLGVLAIGTGSVGSFNYAAQQKLESQRDRAQFKSPGGIRKSDDIFFTKRDDRFLRTYRQNISPSAEQGYKDLKSIRRQHRVLATGEGTVAGLVGGLTLANVRRHGARLPTIAGLAGTALSTANSAYEARGARAMTRRIDKIKAKGIERAGRGEMSPDRVGKRDGQHPMAGAALATAGLAGIGASVGTKQVLDAAVTHRLNRAESLHRSSMYLAGKPRQHEKAKKRVIEAANANRKARVASALGITNPHSQNALRWGAGAVGGTLLYAGARMAAKRPKETASKADKRDVDAAAAGSVAGLLGYQGTGMAISHRNARHEATISQHPDLKRIEREYRKQVGVPGTHYQARKPSQRYFRNYPKRLPGARTKRILSRTHGDNAFGIGSTIAATTLGAVGAVAARRKLSERKETASKAFLRVPKINYTRRIGAGLTTPRPRTGGIRRYPSGVTATFRGSTR